MTDDRLAELLRDAVADVEPANRLAEIRARTASPARAAARPWFYTAGAAVLATAAAVTTFAVLGNDGGDPEPGPSHHGHELIPAYYLDDTTRGPRLFREFVSVQTDDPLNAALDRIQGPADDPDYRTPWSPGSFESATLGDGTIDVELGDAGIDLAADTLPVQQLIYTLQGAAGNRLPVQLVENGEPVGDPVDAAPQNDVLNPMSISDPAEGNAYEGSFVARGRANSPEANVLWEIRDGETVVKEGFTTATGTMDRLYPWEAEVDLAGLEPGTYTFVALTSDPSGGTEGFGPASDTRTIVVR